jgi:hypothetical protein
MCIVFAATNFDTDPDATSQAFAACVEQFGAEDCKSPTFRFANECESAALSAGRATTFHAGSFSEARRLAQQVCDRPDSVQPCRVALTVCDGTSDPHPVRNTLTTSLPYDELRKPNTLFQTLSQLLDLGAVGTGISFGLGIILALLIYAKRAAIANAVIHGNLPRTLTVYADDIEVLFKRSQRVNWYGRVVFGITARLGMTEKQLTLVRRYWLGRVVAFDSLRRQRQNELARMHLQLAASIKPEPKDKKALSQFFAFVKTVFLFAFYLLRALFSFLFGFLFIRITIAKLARGKLIESKDLVLVLQAKEAIEETAGYLKEYLTVAETFDGREELFESK